MSLEETIAALLEQRRAEALEEAYPGEGSNKEDAPTPQGSSAKASWEVTNKGVGGDKGTNRLAPGVGAKEEKPTPQGSSEDPSWEALGDSDSADTGKNASAKMKEDNKKPMGKGAGNAPNYSTVADPASVVNQPMSKGNVGEPGRATFEQVSKFFDGEELTEEFKTKATNLISTLVTARIAEEREILEAELAETAVAHILQAEHQLAEEVDKALEYYAENWIKEHQVDVDSALKLEMAQNFFAGLRQLYEENHVELPEDGTNIVEGLLSEIESLKAELNSQVELGIAAVEESKQLQRDKALAESAQGLALTDAEKLSTLCADLVFEDADSFKGKIKIIRESYFAKSAPINEDTSIEVEDATEIEEVISDPIMDQYVKAIRSSATGF